MSNKEKWSNLPLKRQVEVLKLRKKIQKKAARSYTDMMIGKFPEKYEGKVNKLHNFVNGRTWTLELEEDFKSLNI